MAGRLLRDPDQDGWERSDMPIVCESCLGPNPFVRMQRIEFGGQCHISGRPYTVFRWRPGNDARYKKTIICQEVAKQKNVCQVCLLDLEYNLPVQVRDQALGIENEDEPQSEVGKEFKLQQAMAQGQTSSSFAQSRPNELLAKLQRRGPYYERNKARVCTFWLKGECTRGAECPYRHEMPNHDKELANQNIKDRYHGVNDPVANKMLKRAEDFNKLTPPEDTTITTLYVGGLSSEVTEQDLRDQFYPFGEIASVRMVEPKACAFVTYTTRDAAEKAAEELSGSLVVKGTKLRLLWGRPQEARPPREGDDPNQPSNSGRSPALVPHSVQANLGMAAPAGSGPNYFGLPPGAGGGAPPPSAYYPSMDPSAMGTRAAGPPGAGGEQQQKRGPGDDGSGGEHKRPRPMPYPPPGYGAQPQMPGMPPPMGPGTGFGRPPMGGPPMPMPPPHMMMPPPGPWPMQGPPPPGGIYMPPPGPRPMMPPPHGGPPPRPMVPAGGPPPQPVGGPGQGQ